MITIDDRINNKNPNIFSQLIEKKLEYYKHDKLMYSNAVYGIVGICAENNFYAVTNLVQVRDYFGANEDVGIFDFNPVKNKDIHSYIQGEEMIEIPVNSIIKKITVVNEHQLLFKDNIQTYDIWITRAIIFELSDGLEILFEKDIWLSEQIYVTKGYNLIDRISKTDTDGWETPYNFKYHRENVVYEASNK